MSKEDKKYKEENKELIATVKSEGWKVVRQKLFDRINDLQSILNLDDVKPEDLLTEVKVRGLVVKELHLFLQEIEGQVNQYEGNTLSPGEIYSDPQIHKRYEVPEE